MELLPVYPDRYHDWGETSPGIYESRRWAWPGYCRTDLRLDYPIHRGMDTEGKYVVLPVRVVIDPVDSLNHTSIEGLPLNPAEVFLGWDAMDGEVGSLPHIRQHLQSNYDDTVHPWSSIEEEYIAVHREEDEYSFSEGIPHPVYPFSDNIKLFPSNVSPVRNTSQINPWPKIDSIVRETYMTQDVIWFYAIGSSLHDHIQLYVDRNPHTGNRRRNALAARYTCTSIYVKYDALVATMEELQASQRAYEAYKILNTEGDLALYA